MKKIYCGIFLSILLSLNFSLKAQVGNNKINVQGRILNSETKLAIEDVIIGIKETNDMEFSDKNGKFVIKAKKGQTLIFSKLGFRTSSYLVNDSVFTIYMKEAQGVKLKELVVLAKKNVNDIDMRDMAGSVTTVDMRKFGNRSELDVMKLLQGEVPGLVVETTGRLGSKPVIRIRGDSSFEKIKRNPLLIQDIDAQLNDDEIDEMLPLKSARKAAANEPLFILDGMVVSSEIFNTLNADDIETIKVLKDAAASALYGIKAANGVIEISSKRGTPGEMIISASMKQGLTLRGQRGAKMMNSAEKLNLERHLKNKNAPGYKYSEENIRNIYFDKPQDFIEQKVIEGQNTLDSLSRIDTDWFDQLLRMSQFQSYSLGLRGGTEKNLYYFSFNFSRQGGRVEGDVSDRFSGRVNLDYVINKKLSISLNFDGGVNQRHLLGDPSGYVYTLNPYETMPKDKTLAQKLYSYSGRTIYELLENDDNNKLSFYAGSSSVFQYQLSDDFQLSGVLGANMFLDNSVVTVSPRAYSQRLKSRIARGVLREGKFLSTNVNLNLRANYQKEFTNSTLMLGGNYDYFYDKLDNLDITGHGLPSKVRTVKGVNQGLSSPQYKPKYDGQKEHTRQIGFGFSAGYNIKGIYDIYGSYKLDRSSLLPKNKRNNSAWSAGLGWSFGEYAFMKNKVFTNAKMRASYGYTAGMAGIDPASTVPIFRYTDKYYAENRSLEMEALYNEEIRPQQMQSINIGLACRFFDIVNLDFDVYRNTTKDALMNIPIVPSSGFSNINKNIGTIQNSGAEFRLSFDLLQKTKFIWNASASIAWNHNKVLSLNEGKTELFLSEDSLVPDLEVGKSINAMYGLRSLGISPLDGLYRYLSKDGREITPLNKITRDDFVHLGSASPIYTGSFNNYLTYENFTLSFNIYFSLGAKSVARQGLVRDHDRAYRNAIKGQTENMWFNPGDENKKYGSPNPPSKVYDTYQYPSSTTIYRADFVRLNSIMLDYRLPHKFLNKHQNIIKHAMISFEAKELFAFRWEVDRGSILNVEQPILTGSLKLNF